LNYCKSSADDRLKPIERDFTPNFLGILYKK
jgi:hypothetical protein